MFSLICFCFCLVAIYYCHSRRFCSHPGFWQSCSVSELDYAKMVSVFQRLLMLHSLIIHCMLSSARAVSNWFPQLITYSAIRDGILISNIADLRAFLHTDIYTSNFWPVYFLFSHFVYYAPSVLWHCWLGGRKGIRPVKNWVVRCWHGYLSGARCKLAYRPADATATHRLLLQ